jgi:hypothetical protein
VDTAVIVGTGRIQVRKPVAGLQFPARPPDFTGGGDTTD